MSEGAARSFDASRAHEDEGSLLDALSPLAVHWKTLLFVPVLVAAIAIGVTFVIAPTFTAKTTILPPQPQQGSAVAALASFGALSALGGVASRTPADQYVSLLQSTTIADRIIDEFKLTEVYETEYQSDTRRKLADKVRLSLGKKDGLITIEVDDELPQRAAAMAGRYIDELRRLTSSLALTEAQQRRAFFEVQVRQTRAQLAQAEAELQASGFNAAALRAEPRAAAEGYARLKSEVTGAEVRLQTLRRTLAEAAPEVLQQVAALGALRAQLQRFEVTSSSPPTPGYISKFREFKYQESLLELLSKQYEMARVDESREGALIQVVDAAQVPDKRSRPKRAVTGVIAWGLSLFALFFLIVGRHAWRQAVAGRTSASAQSTLANVGDNS
jgi:uncharacterized protein involved in exopolysaccharide biosynthesis